MITSLSCAELGTAQPQLVFLNFAKKRSWSEQIFGQNILSKNLGPKQLRFKKMLGPKIFKLKRIVGQNNFESRQILSPENF